jgi:hypothetical protein
VGGPCSDGREPFDDEQGAIMAFRQRGTRRAADGLSWQERHTVSIEDLERQRLLAAHRDLYSRVAATAWII